MNFAVLGGDADALPLIQAIGQSDRHQLTRGAWLGTLLPPVRTAAPGLQIDDQWEDLTAGGTVDAAIITGSRAEVLEAARHLANAGVPLLWFPQAAQQSTLIYELSLIRDDNGVHLLPMPPSRYLPAIVELRRRLNEGDIGPVLHLRFERRIVIENTGPPLLIEPAQVEAALLPDVDLLRSLGGDYHRVTSLPTVTSHGKPAAAHVTLSGDDLPESTWTLTPVASAGGWSLQVVGEAGTLVVSDDGAGATLRQITPRETADQITAAGSASVPDSPQRSSAAAPPQDAGQDEPGESSPRDEGSEGSLGQSLLEQAERGLSGAVVSPDWTDLTRAFEMVDATRRSERRRRTIDLYFETQSERNLFKTQMTAIGCGLLSLTLLAMLLVLLIGAAFQGDREDQVIRQMLRAGRTPAEIAADRDELHDLTPEQVHERVAHVQTVDRILGIVRVLIFVPIAIYLLLQGLLVLTRPASTETDRKEEAAASGESSPSG